MPENSSQRQGLSSLPYGRDMLNSRRLPEIPSQPFHHISPEHTEVWQAQLSGEDSRCMTLLDTEPLHGLVAQFESPHLPPLNPEIHSQASSSLTMTERNSGDMTCYPDPPPRKRQKKLSESGCATCRRRRMVCDEKKPSCKSFLSCLFFNSSLTITPSRCELLESW